MAAKGKDKCSVENIEKKLLSVNSSQDSVQAMSMWIMHNRSHHQIIVDTWLKVLKKSDTKQKLTLFYLCNDVVQHAKKKKALYYLENFKDNLREAVMHVKDADKIKPNIERVFNIWEQRRTYDIKFILELRRILSGDLGGSSSKESSAKSTPASPYSPFQEKKAKRRDKKQKEDIESGFKPSKKHRHEEKERHEEPVEEVPEDLGEFKPSKFIDEVKALRQTEIDLGLKAKQLTMMRIDATNVDAVKQLKDRSHGADFCKQFEESCIKIEDYVAILEGEIKERKHVLTHCELAETFYEEQFKEAKIVATAYKNYGARITNMKKRVDDMKKIIPATPSPVPSPSADAPSPGNTPVLPEMDDNDMVDMELCEEDQEEARKQKGSEVTPPARAYTAMVKSISQPIPSLTNITMGEKEDSLDKKEVSLSPADSKSSEGESTFQGSNILESRIANMLPNLAKGSSNIGLNMPSAPPGKEDDFSPSPPKPREPEPSDDRASTPVQDEQEEKTPSPVKVSQPSSTKSAPSTKAKPNPIDFLSQLLTKSSNTSSSSNFLHSLSLLTNTVKNQQKKEEVSENVNSLNSDEPSSLPITEVTMSFGGVPAPQPVTQTSSWPEWKLGATSIKPPLPPQSDNTSPPVPPTGVPPRFPPQPPLPQHPPPPLNVPPPQPYPVQPPSPQDFSMPPPMSQTFPRTPISRPFIAPQQLSQAFNQPPPPPPHSALVNSPVPLPVNPISPTQLPPQRPQFSQGFPFGMPPGQNGTVTSAAPPSPGVYPPPPPPQSVAPPPPPWQKVHGEVPVSTFNNRIATVPSTRSAWNETKEETEYDPSWVEDGEETDGSNGGYAHPWDQPQNYEEEEEEENNEVVIVPPRPVTTPKSILRNSRSSSLREVILVDEEEEGNSESVNSVSAPRVAPEVKPVGILKKPPTDIQTADHVGDVQSEFIAKLKQKSGGVNVPIGPPSNRNLTSVPMGDTAGLHDGINTGEQHISTIGVLGMGSRTNSVKSDDMDIDNGEDEGNIEVNNENEWVDPNDNNEYTENEWVGNTEAEEWLEERQGYISREYDPNVSHDQNNPNERTLPHGGGIPRERIHPLDGNAPHERIIPQERIHPHDGSIPHERIMPMDGNVPHERLIPVEGRFPPPDGLLPHDRNIPPVQQPIVSIPQHEVLGLRPRFEEHHIRPPPPPGPSPPRAYSYDHPPRYPVREEFRHPHFQDQFRGPPPAKRPFYPSPGLRMPYYRY